MPPRTSGRRVDSTAARIRSTARSPAATSTPERLYALRGSATDEKRLALFEHELALRRVIRNRFRVVAVEARETELLVRQVEGGEHAADREVRERIRADEVADLRQRVRRCDQLRLDLGVDPVEA